LTAKIDQNNSLANTGTVILV